MKDDSEQTVVAKKPVAKAPPAKAASKEETKTAAKTTAGPKASAI